PKDREVQLCEGVAAGHAAEPEYALTHLLHKRLFGAESGQLASEIGLDRRAHIRRAGRIDRESAIVVLPPPHSIIAELTDLRPVRIAQELEQQHVLCFQNRVALQLAHP